METLQTSVNMYQITWHPNAQDRSINVKVREVYAPLITHVIQIES
jgi:hypothetical protein